jgi:hypothetical protein
MSKTAHAAAKSAKPAKAGSAKAEVTSTGRDRATQHHDAKRLGKY